MDGDHCMTLKAIVEEHGGVLDLDAPARSELVEILRSRHQDVIAVPTPDPITEAWVSQVLRSHMDAGLFVRILNQSHIRVGRL